MTQPSDKWDEIANGLFMGITRREIEEDGRPFIKRIATALRSAYAEGEKAGMERAAVLLEGGYERPVGKSWFPDGRRNKNDKCPHGVWMYEECQACDINAIRAAKETKP